MSEEFLGLKPLTTRQEEKFPPDHKHTFSTNWTTDTNVHLVNNDIKGHMTATVAGQTHAGDVPPKEDVTDKRYMAGQSVTVHNDGKSEFVITVW